jgi:hypothetical protein
MAQYIQKPGEDKKTLEEMGFNNLKDAANQ